VAACLWPQEYSSTTSIAWSPTLFEFLFNLYYLFVCVLLCSYDAADWQSELKGLPTQAYLSKCRLVKVCYEDYIDSRMMDSGFTKRQAHSDWVQTFNRLSRCKHPGAQRKGDELKKKWGRNEHKKKDDVFWRVQGRKHAAKVQSIRITRMTEKSVNKELRSMFQAEMGMSFEDLLKGLGHHLLSCCR